MAGKTWLLLATALLSSVLLVLVFPPFDLRLLAPIALAPLLYSVAQLDRWKTRFLIGWMAGFAYWFGVCTWIQFVLAVHGGMGTALAWVSFFLFCAFKGLHLAVFAMLAGPLMRTVYALPAVAALWAGLERTHGPFGFAWLQLGNAGIDMSVPLRAAPFLGVYGVSFVFAMLAAAVACLMLRRPRIVLAPVASLLLLYALPAIPEGVKTSDEALVVQPNIDPETQWSYALQSTTEQRLTEISNLLPAPLVIWPETPAPFYYYDDPELRRDAQSIASKHGAFLFETVAFTGEHEPLNSALMIGANGAAIGRYDQINLVPFGEYVPPLFSWVNRITKETSDFVPGHDIEVLPAVNHRFGTFICYESAFPDLVRQFAKSGADVLVNLSNDGYFGHSKARQQHLLLVRMRAVENRRFIIRSTNDGITAVVDPAGQIRRGESIEPYHEAAAILRYGAVSGTTFYSRLGDWFAWTCLACALLLSAFRGKRRFLSAHPQL